MSYRSENINYYHPQKLYDIRNVYRIDFPETILFLIIVSDAVAIKKDPEKNPGQLRLKKGTS